MSLYFCQDGVLRVQDCHKQVFVSLYFLQQQQEFDDFDFWMQWWQEPIIFEENLTLAKFFKCLEPWASFWGKVLQKDLVEFCHEIKKPCYVNKVKQLDWISLDYHIELFPEVSYPDDTTEHAVLKDTWNINQHYQLSAYILNDNKQHTIHHHPLNYLANIPFILNPQQILIVDEFFINKYGKSSQLLLNQEGLGSLKIDNNELCPFSFIQGNKQHILRDVLEGFFNHFDYSPCDRDEINQVIQENIDITIENYQNNENIQWDSLEDIFFEQRSIIQDFNPLDTDYYQAIFKNAFKDKESELRIGKINIAHSPEKRLLSWNVEF